MKFLKKNFLLLLIVSLFLFIGSVKAAVNPYGKYQDLYGVKTVRCTWFAWQETYEKAGVALPGWGNAQTWYNSAAMAGYKVGKEAKANSIAVYSSSDGYGHVAYVVSVDSDGAYMTVNEGGIPIEENEGIVIGSRPSTRANNLIGFIYLDEVPKNNSSSTSSSNSGSSNSLKKKSSNNNLSSLSIDIADFEFDSDILEYNLEVTYDKQIITIKGEAEDSTAIVTGTGEKALKVGINTYKITITAEDGSTKEYTINITRNAKIEKNVEENVSINKSDNKPWIIVICGILLIAFSLGIILLIKHKKK